MLNALFFAILSPIVYGLINVYDKLIVEHRMKDSRSYAVFSGISILAISIIFAMFLNWNGLSITGLLFPVITGALSGINSWIYYKVISKEDITNVIGMIYIYPIVVSTLSFIFLSEKLPFFGYIGAMLAITGAILLSTNLKNIKKGMLIYLGFMIVIAGTSEFLMKVGTSVMPALNCVVINNLIVSIVLICGLLSKDIRKSVRKDMKAAHLAFIIQPAYYLANMSLFIAMSGLPATIVSSIATMQPLVVLVSETIINRFYRIASHESLKNKILATILIIAGIILLYLTEFI